MINKKRTSESFPPPPPPPFPKLCAFYFFASSFFSKFIFGSPFFGSFPPRISITRPFTNENKYVAKQYMSGIRT